MTDISMADRIQDLEAEHDALAGKMEEALEQCADALNDARLDLLTAAEARAAAAEAERDRLAALLKARDAFDAGEPSKPPHTGKDRGALAKVEKTYE